MKIPRDVNGRDLAKALSGLGYQIERQRGSHIVLGTKVKGEHHVAVPDHRPLKLGMLRGILKAVSTHHELTLEGLLEILDL
jgi:predicted RNA binding protein YcfA (HicA-like mRNA interferase family)